ncbi:MAG: hypothetical protein IPI64_15055 [Chloracidobacterium sp.]|nr:hypothetical protein [Chloracidobacterium sp.]
MKKFITLGAITFAISITGCTFNLGTPSNTSTASAPTTADNKPVTTTNTAAAPKKEAEAPKEPDPGSSAVKPGTTRVQFAKGDTSAYVTKDILANGSVNFVFNVQKGQTVDYTVAYDFDESDITVYRGEPGDQDSSIPSTTKAPQTFVAKKSGDHRLEVTNTTNKKLTVTLYLDAQ